jgi:hypothetical protein
MKERRKRNDNEKEVNEKKAKDILSKKKLSKIID